MDLNSSEKTYDYIICGGGTSGCVIASRLASKTAATILLVEAGRDAGTAPDVLVPGKYLNQLSADPDGLWQLPTEPQRELNDRTILFLRGKQLGGSSAVNYMALARGPAADYDEWARLTCDQRWSWEMILPLMKELEDFRPGRPVGFEDYAHPDPDCHGSGGPLKVGFGDEMTPGVATFFEACQQVGIGVCLDNNSGNPVGVGLAQFNTGSGVRSYAANAFLDDRQRCRSENLTLLTHTSVDKILLENTRAIGVELFDHNTGERSQVKCRSEVIICQGTFGSPQLLMLSGIGPRQDLESLGIDVVIENSSVGKNMLDHSILTVEYQVDDEFVAHDQIFSSPKLLSEADAQYENDKTGPHAMFGTSGSVAFPKIGRLYTTDEFGQLDQDTRTFLLEPTRPSAEIWLGSGPASFQSANPADTHITHELLFQNNLSKGVVSLQSSNPRDLPKIDPHFLEHPFDKRIAIETVREAINIGRAPAYESTMRRMVHGPSGDDDESILEFVRANLGQGYHSMGTCRMGSSKSCETVVDTDFRVVGLAGLRVADLSVCPILTCNHTQINAYLIGELCARSLLDKLQESQDLIARL